MKEDLNIALLRAQNDLQRYKLTVLNEEIDDNISQLLSSIKMLLGLTGKNVYPLEEIVQTTQETLTLAMQELHLLSISLDDTRLVPFDLTASVGTEVERINHWKKANIMVSLPNGSLPLTAPTQVILFSVIIDLLTNNSEPANGEAVVFERCEGEVKITISYHNAVPGAHLPWKRLKKIQTYLQVIGGRMDCFPGKKHGREIVLSIPVNHQNVCV